jgi:molecular chaperone GrpE
VAHEDENNNGISNLDNRDAQTDTTGTGRAVETEELERNLAAKTEEAQGLQERLLRLGAEFDNYKRIAQREQREQAKFANETLLKDLLPTVDNLERAIGFASSAPGSGQLVEGVKLTLKQFLETLMKFGIRPIASVGQPFDPALHQAVAHVPTREAAPNTVVEEYQKGYLLHDRVLRAAMVAVAAPAQEGE